MTNRHCPHCNQIKPRSQFNQKHADCRDCQSVASIRRRTKVKIFLRRVRAMVACICCGLADARLIDFHHINAESKHFGLSVAARNRAGIATLKTELRKCIPVCCACHRLIHIECVI